MRRPQGPDGRARGTASSGRLTARARACTAPVLGGLASARPRYEPYPAESTRARAGTTASVLSENTRALSRRLESN